MGALCANITITAYYRLPLVKSLLSPPSFKCCAIRIGYSFLGCRLLHGGADKSLARPTSRYILLDGENISFDASLVLYI